MWDCVRFLEQGSLQVDITIQYNRPEAATQNLKTLFTQAKVGYVPRNSKQRRISRRVFSDSFRSSLLRGGIALVLQLHLKTAFVFAFA